ncbi:centrosomal protein of 295 kDa isoform X8 [Nannospalax galili]|uniref:centrosomal protein of 295 kDa isoform X8 n=1 Tax=Nannospalax galili TaxID=1026970 RepID=UPI0004ED40AB|nr:centrosomal protein of 295 kDa isoform X8 [Nannospalax galili]
MTEVTRAGQWLPCRCPNGCWEVGRPRAFSPGEAWPNALSDSLYLRYTKMKRKVGKAGKLRLSPNEEAFVLKEDYERRRRLRLLQVREQERGIAFQIREDVKQRRNQQLTRLAEELRAEWEEAQSQKIQNLEKLYLASLRHMGEGHQRAKENEPDVDAVARRATERKRKAEMRHKEALKVQKSQKEMLTKQKTRHIKARKEALLVERERSARITRLPAPVPAPFENIEVNRISSLKTNSSTYHHISTFVSRQMDTKQPDAHLAAEEEARRLEELRKQATQQRLVQCEKAHVRGSQAMKKLHLAQNQERLMEELRQLQKEDLARRRQAVAQMPSQLIELPYKRSELKEDWQRELEFAFEDVYSADRKVRGNLILHLEPEPLPSVTDQLKDEELDLSVEQETENPQVPAAEMPCSSDADGPLAVKSQQIPSKILFRRLLNKIRSQKSLWTIKSMSEDESEVLTELSEAENQSTADAGAAASEERTSSEQERVVDSDRLTIESQPLSSDEKPFFCQAGLGKEQATTASPPVTAVAPNSVLLHPQEEAVRVRMSARHKQMMELEEQKQKQLELLEQIEQQKLRLETDCFRAQLEEEKRKKTQQTEVGLAPALCAVISDEDSHRQMIRNYQQQLLQQNRLHKQFVETARKRLLEFQTTLKERYPSLSATSPIPDSVISEPQQRSRTPTPVSEQWDQTPRLKMNRHQPVQPRQNPILDQGHIQTALTQQDNSSLQKQLDLQREVLQSRQEAQEDLLLQRQTALQQQVQKHQETLKDFFNDSQTRKSTVENDLKMQKMEQLREWLPHILDLTWDDRESISHTEKYSSDGDQLLSAGVSGEALDQELSRRASKPPISKVKCGLDVDQHELSTIQEVDSSTSGRASTPGKRDFYHDRDPLRVSVSREQSFLGSPLARDSSDCRHPPSQENTRLLLEHHDFDEAVKVKEPSIEDHEVLSHAASDEDVCACLGTVTKPGDKAEIQEMSQEPLSSITVSTGSFLSYENTDVSLTDPESSSEQLDHQERESTTSKQEEADPSSSVVPAPQVAPPQQKSLDAHGSLLPAGDRSASDHAHFEQITGADINEAQVIPEKRDLQTDDLDFPELEHVFPHLHHQLFKPLEPHVDFDLSSPFGLSQDNRDSYQHSSDSSEKQHANTSSASTVSFTPLRTHLNPLNTKPDQDPDINLANAADQSFVTENAEGSEQAFQQLLPEFSSQESQHADLPSIYSIEARGTCQGVEEQNFPSEMLQNKRKSVHFQASLSSVCSSSDDQLHVQPSTPQDSISSECSVKQLENREERLVFEELSRKAVTMLQSQRLTEGDNTACSILPQLCVPAVTMETSLQPPQSIKMETPRATRSPSQLTQPDPVECSPSFPLQSSIPVWETESGYGIMEEPELTLVSISDISAAETDFANLTLEEGENEANGCFQAETETSDYPVEPELFMGHCTVMAPTATPSSLQEAFVKRKKSFIERSYQRLREIQNKARLPQTKTAKETGMSGSSSHLRGVNTVRVSLPEERRSAQALGHQQALRLHSQSAELKQQREEKAKQEACAHSRARAKEFHKKTLEKLRAKNTC